MLTQERLYSCDSCKNPVGEAHLKVDVYNMSSLPLAPGVQPGSSEHHYCSWFCVIGHLPAVKSSGSVNLPALIFYGDDIPPGQAGADFFKAIAPTK